MLVMSLEGSVGVAVGLGGDSNGDGEALTLPHPDHCLTTEGARGTRSRSAERLLCGCGAQQGDPSVKKIQSCLSLLGFPFQWQKEHKTDNVMNYLSTSPINSARKK